MFTTLLALTLSTAPIAEARMEDCIAAASSSPVVKVKDITTNLNYADSHLAFTRSGQLLVVSGERSQTAAPKEVYAQVYSLDGRLSRSIRLELQRPVRSVTTSSDGAMGLVRASTETSAWFEVETGDVKYLNISQEADVHWTAYGQNLVLVDSHLVQMATWERGLFPLLKTSAPITASSVGLTRAYIVEATGPGKSTLHTLQLTTQDSLSLRIPFEVTGLISPSRSEQAFLASRDESGVSIHRLLENGTAQLVWSAEGRDRITDTAIMENGHHLGLIVKTKSGGSEGYVINLQSGEVEFVLGTGKNLEGSNSKNKNVQVSGKSFVFGSKAPQTLTSFNVSTKVVREMMINDNHELDADYAVNPALSGLLFVDKWNESTRNVNPGFYLDGRRLFSDTPTTTGLPVFSSQGNMVAVPYKLSATRLGVQTFRIEDGSQPRSGRSGTTNQSSSHFYRPPPPPPPAAGKISTWAR
jgi:hypothetical protein